MRVKYLIMHELTVYECGQRELPPSLEEGMGWEKKTECTVGPSGGALVTLHHIPVYRHALALSACHCLPLTLRVFVSKQ